MNAPVRPFGPALRLAIAVLLVSAPAAALAQQEQAGTPPPEPTAEAATMTSDRVINMILVKVNGLPIFLSDLQTELENQMAVLRTQFAEAELEAQLPTLRVSVLTSLIDDRMMMQRADQMGITADANQVDRAIQNLRQQNNLVSDEDFQAALQTMNLTVDELRERMRRQIRQQQLVFQEVQRGIFVGESEIARYYESNTEQFTAPEQVRIEQLVFVGGDGLRQRAEAALEELRAGEDLQTVASRYPDASAFPAGEAFIAVEDLTTSLSQAVPELDEGVYSEPIQSQFGWHIVRVVARQEHMVRPLDDVKDAIRQRLTAEKSQQRLADYLGQLREQTHLEILAQEFNDIEQAWMRPEEETDPTTERE